MPLITHTCSNCTGPVGPSGYAVRRAPGNLDKLSNYLCSLRCLALWAMRLGWKKETSDVPANT